MAHVWCHIYVTDSDATLRNMVNNIFGIANLLLWRHVSVEISQISDNSTVVQNFVSDLNALQSLTR